MVTMVVVRMEDMAEREWVLAVLVLVHRMLVLEAFLLAPRELLVLMALLVLMVVLEGDGGGGGTGGALRTDDGGVHCPDEVAPPR